MERPNYFDILGLPFDPPESNIRKINAAIDKWEKSTREKFNSASDTEKTKLGDELAMKADIVAVMSAPKTRNPEARAMKDLQTKKLESLIDIMLMSQEGTPEVTAAQIRNVSFKLMLSDDTVKKIYTAKGFTIQKPHKALSAKDTFISGAITSQIEGELSHLRSTNIPLYPWSSKVHDLFDLACYYSGGTSSDAPSYRKKKTDDLKAIMTSGSVSLANDMSDIAHTLRGLFSKGETQIFDSEANRQRYVRTLELQKLDSFWTLLKNAPDCFKRDAYFAESCIKKIQKSFPDYDMALAIYNYEAGLLTDPYEPMEALIHVTCATCKSSSEFRSREQAQKAKCPVCGAALYTRCPKCKKMVPASASRCTCGFNIMEMLFFDDYVKAAEFSLSEMDLDEARRQLSNAENANPDHPSLPDLRKRVQDATQAYQKPLDDLQKLISARRFCEADKLLNSLAVSMPKLKLGDKRKIVQAELTKAQNLMPGPAHTGAARANRCLDILDSVADYQPAIDLLKTCRPTAPAGLHLTVQGNNNSLSCCLTWDHTGERGVTYTVVRKKQGVPQNHADGTTLATAVEKGEYTDKSFQPGVVYGYAVFACRYSIYSDPVTGQVQQFSELSSDSLQSIADNGACHFSWVPPRNCIGVRILRSENGIPSTGPAPGTTVVADNVSANFDDTQVQNGTTYGYRLQCIYPNGNGFRYSTGVTVMLVPQPMPVAVRNVNIKTSQNNVSVSWNCPPRQTGQVVLRQVLSPEASEHIGQVLPSSEINRIFGGSRTLSSVVCDAQKCSFGIPADSSVTFAIVSFSGSNGIISHILQASSLQKCEIDRQRTKIEGGDVHLIISNPPDYLRRVHYTMATKFEGSSAPWATVDEAKSGLMHTISANDYTSDGLILLSNPPQDDLYITVIGEYKMSDGSIVFAEPSKLKLSNRPKQKISYFIDWHQTGFLGNLFGHGNQTADLHILCSAPETPVMKLVYRTDGHIPMSLNEPGTQVLCIVNEREGGLPNGELVCTISAERRASLPSHAELRLMLDHEAMVEFQTLPSDLSTLRVP